MPIGRDLGFPYLVVFLVLVGQVVIGLLVRRRWRRSAGRREEIKRLLVMASEEEDAARAELEASAGYASNLISAPYASSLISAPLQYQCAVCFSPTTTRCARCKSIRYWYGNSWPSNGRTTTLKHNCIQSGSVHVGPCTSNGSEHSCVKAFSS